MSSDAPLESTEPRPTKTPVVILALLILANVLVSFIPLRTGNPMLEWHAELYRVLPLDQWIGSVSLLQSLTQLLLLLLLIPAAITALAIPFKLRDRSFQLLLVFQMGLFVALIFALQMMRIKG
ncbi:MAG: hypothetical protein VXW65_07725 [Pseudomonadota bacterium]|nr:hypothetical protein [Pseudomonadota bacterium]